MELFDVYTIDRLPTGRTLVRGQPQPQGDYRMVVHVCIFNSRGMMLIQQRANNNHDFSGMWDVSVGGGAAAGDSSRSAAHRELLEELGLDVSFEELRPRLTINFDGGFDDVYIIEREVQPEEIRLQQEEVQAARWATREEILQMIDEGTFIPYHKGLIELLFALRHEPGAWFRNADGAINGKR
ncbi:MAG: NUDIX domain-containing protein [Ruminococcaceae bacterium]|nr:NUDIX domain-containing protein [Oscillospiraceae bacterium]